MTVQFHGCFQFRFKDKTDMLKMSLERQTISLRNNREHNKFEKNCFVWTAQKKSELARKMAKILTSLNEASTNKYSRIELRCFISLGFC